MSSGDHWDQVYGAKRPDEVSWYQASPAPSLEALDRLGADPSLSFVDVGGGASTLIDALLDQKWRDITVVDIAESALAASRERLCRRAGEVDWQVADIRDWRPTRTFDVWHDRAVFHFLTEDEERAAYKQALHAGTHAGSHVVIATFAPDGPEMCSGLPVRRYDAETLAAELGEGFSLRETWDQQHETPWGAKQSFLWAVFERQ